MSFDSPIMILLVQPKLLAELSFVLGVSLIHTIHTFFLLIQFVRWRLRRRNRLQYAHVHGRGFRQHGLLLSFLFLLLLLLLCQQRVAFPLPVAANLPRDAFVDARHFLPHGRILVADGDAHGFQAVRELRVAATNDDEDEVDD